MRSKNKKSKRAKLRKGCAVSAVITTLIVIGVVIGFAVFGFWQMMEMAQNDTALLLASVMFVGLLYVIWALLYGLWGLAVCVPFIIAIITATFSSGLTDDDQPKFRKVITVSFLMDILSAILISVSLYFITHESLAFLVGLPLVIFPIFAKTCSCIASHSRRKRGKPLVDSVSLEPIIPETNVKFDSLKNFTTKKK